MAVFRVFRRILSLALGLVSVVGALFWLVYLVPIATTALAARDWPVVPAKIRSVELLPGRASQPKERRLVAAYSFRFGDRSYESNRVSLEPAGYSFDQRLLADREAILAAHLHTGAPMPVRVSPSDPANSIIFIELPPDVIGQLIAAMLFLFGGVVAFALAFVPSAWEHLQETRPIAEDSNGEAVRKKLVEIETEMRRIGYWSDQPMPIADHSKLYSNLTFENWLQFVFLQSVRNAVESGDFSLVPRYRVGLCAMRNYDYHSFIPQAQQLHRLCQDLETLLEPHLGNR